MVVEDEGILANDLAKSLEKLGYHPTAVVSSVEQALGRIPVDRPDLVLMDINLGHGATDGIIGANRVREDFDLPVVFLTAHSDKTTIERAKAVEPFGYLVKPIRAVNLPSVIELALYKHAVEKRLKQRESWLTAVLETEPSPTILTDLEGRICFCNPATARLLQIDFAGLNGKTFREIAVCSDSKTYETADDLIAAVLLLRKAVKFPSGLSLTTPDGIRLIEGEVSPTFVGGKLTGALVALRDVDERTKEELAIAQESTMLAVSRMAGGVAQQLADFHDIIWSRSMLLSGDGQDSESLHLLGEIGRAAFSASKILRKLSSFSRPQHIASEIVNLNDHVLTVVHFAKSRLSPTITINTCLEERLFPIWVNPSDLDTVLTSLLINAVESMPFGGTIVISTANVERESARLFGLVFEEYVRLVVADSGTGVPPEAQKRVFEPFYLSQDDGFRLATVYKLVKDADGEIALSSDAVSGTNFEILLPKHISSKVSSSEVIQQIRHVLLVEPNAAVRLIIGRHLENEGFFILFAQDSAEAIVLASLFEGAIDVAIFADGEQKLAGELRRTRPNSKTLVLASGASDKCASGAGIAPDARLYHPFTLSELTEAIRDIIASAEATILKEPRKN